MFRSFVVGVYGLQQADRALRIANMAAGAAALEPNATLEQVSGAGVDTVATARDTILQIYLTSVTVTSGNRDLATDISVRVERNVLFDDIH